MMMKRVIGLLFGAALVLSACAADEEDEMIDYDADGIAQVSQRLADAADIAHACEHAQNPPGGAYTATTATSSASNSSPVWTDHTSYNVTLPGSGSNFAGWGRFTADGTAEFAIYTDPSTTVTVRKRNSNGTLGTQVSQAWTSTISAATCPASSNPALPTYGTSAGLSRVRTYNLTLNQGYYVKFNHTANKMLSIFENLDE